MVRRSLDSPDETRPSQEGMGNPSGWGAAKIHATSGWLNRPEVAWPNQVPDRLLYL